MWVPFVDGFLHLQYYKHWSTHLRVQLMDEVSNKYPEMGYFVNQSPIKIIAENAINTKNRNDLARGVLRRASAAQMESLGMNLRGSHLQCTQFRC